MPMNPAQEAAIPVRTMRFMSTSLVSVDGKTPGKGRYRLDTVGPVPLRTDEQSAGNSAVIDLGQARRTPANVQLRLMPFVASQRAATRLGGIRCVSSARRLSEGEI